MTSQDARVRTMGLVTIGKGDRGETVVSLKGRFASGESRFSGRSPFAPGPAESTVRTRSPALSESGRPDRRH